MNLNPFKKKKNDELQVEEEENQFQPYEENEPSDTIETEEEERERRGRRLKSKVIAGGALAVALIIGYMMFSNLFAPPEKKEVQQVETRRNIGDVELKGAPQNYEQLAKYDADKKKKQEAEKRAEEERLAKERAKMNPPQSQQAPVKEKTPARKVEPPKQTSYTSNVSLPSAPSVPSVSNVQGSKERADSSANKSSIGFNVGGGTAGGLFGSYSASSDSKVDTASSYTIQAGTVVPATLLMGIDTRSSDMVTAQIRQDVYDSLTGQHLLLPQGAKLIGKVNGGGGRRVGVEFERIILPDGTSISIPKQKSVDNQGFGGMKDKYDTHESDFYRGALISAVVGFLADAVDEHFDRKNSNNDGNAAETAMTKAVENITDHIMERSSKTEGPNSIIWQGFQFNVLITQDFNAYEYLR